MICMTEKSIIYVGFTGPMGAGKGAAIEELHNSLSHIVRAEATAQGIEHTRENLIDLGNSLRKQHGFGVLGHKTAGNLNAQKYAFEIIDGIRHPEEARALKEGLDNFMLIAVTAEPEIRYERILSRKRPSDPTTIKEIEEKDLKDRAIGIDACIEIADFVIPNNNIKLTKLREIVREVINSYIAMTEF